jgi:hypothetical protein
MTRDDGSCIWAATYSPILRCDHNKTTPISSVIGPSNIVHLVGIPDDRSINSDVDRVVWKRELNCPSGGSYRWNEQYKTMESSVYGHPAEPKNGPHVARLLGNWETGNFGLTFENQGLRAQFELTGPGADQAKHNR